MDVDAIVILRHALSVPMTYVTNVNARMTVFKHEDLLIDLRNTNKAKLYKSGKLMFIGDGYRAITMMIRNSKDNKIVRQKFMAQLTQREKCKLTMKKGK